MLLIIDNNSNTTVLLNRNNTNNKMIIIIVTSVRVWFSTVVVLVDRIPMFVLWNPPLQMNKPVVLVVF